MITINARKHTFTDFVQVLDQIGILERTEFVETTGAWSYYQILKHCTDQINFSMFGFPYTYSPFLRKTVGKYLLSKLLERGFMLPDGYNGQMETARIEGDDKNALTQLKSAIYTFRKFNKDFAIHPLYDIMDKPTWEKFHSIHIANHLSFVETFPIELELEENVEEAFFSASQNSSNSKILSIHSLSKLEALDEATIKRKSNSKSKMKSVVQKRKR
jgi:hypothetical protein